MSSKHLLILKLLHNSNQMFGFLLHFTQYAFLMIFNMNVNLFYILSEDMNLFILQ